MSFGERNRYPVANPGRGPNDDHGEDGQEGRRLPMSECNFQQMLPTFPILPARLVLSSGFRILPGQQHLLVLEIHRTRRMLAIVEDRLRHVRKPSEQRQLTHQRKVGTGIRAMQSRFLKYLSPKKSEALKICSTVV